MQTQINFNVHTNSLNVYKTKVLPTLKGRKLQVLEAIKELGGEATAWEISQFLNKPIHTFSGRITELKKASMIMDTGINKIINGSTFSILKLI